MNYWKSVEFQLSPDCVGEATKNVPRKSNDHLYDGEPAAVVTLDYPQPQHT